MKKLIKLNDQHYIVVDDSEIKENDPIYTKEPIPDIPNSNISKCIDSKRFYELGEPSEWKKITHSIQPLENVQTISLSEVEEVINGYNDLETFSWEKAKNLFLENENREANVNDNKDLLVIGCLQEGIITGFKAHNELVKDKLFTEEDMINAFNAGRQGFGGAIRQRKYDWDNPYDYVKSLLPKTEWDVEIDEQNKITLI